jgi:radical SAM superfamily enzyme YgiQ (UPF0313 family)
MRVLLISANKEDVNMVALPLGLALVGSFLEKQGHEVQMVDLMRAEDVRGPVEEALRRFGPEAIGISVRNIDDQNMAAPRFLLDQVKPVIGVCREASEAPIFLGGAGYSIFPEAVLEYLGADYGIQGEGEWAAARLLEYLAVGQVPKGLPGLYVRGSGPAAPGRLYGKMDALPWAEALRKLAVPGDGSETFLPLQTRRGCPMGCSYCSTPAIEGGRIRKCSPKISVGAMATCLDAGFDNFFITDNTFNLPPSHAKEFCRTLIGQGLKPQWRCIIYPGRLDEELAELMAQAGCTDVSLGAESGDDWVLGALGKRFTADRILADRRLLGRVGIRTMGFLMLGVPGESRDSVRRSLDFVEELAPEMLRLTLGVRVYPYTRLAEYVVKRGLAAADDDLLRPTFFMEPRLRDWLPDTAATWAAGKPNCFM